MKVHAESRPQTGAITAAGGGGAAQRTAKVRRQGMSASWIGSWVAVCCVIGAVLGFFTGMMLALTDEAVRPSPSPLSAVVLVVLRTPFPLRSSLDHPFGCAPRFLAAKQIHRIPSFQNVVGGSNVRD